VKELTMPSALSRLAHGLKYSSILAKAIVLKNWNEAVSRRYLLESLGSMPGVSAKAAQFLAMKLEGEAADSNPVLLEPMPISLVKARIEAEAPRLHEELLEISEQAQVASLGQVHEGRLRSGESVAIKVQFPELQTTFEQQLGLLHQVSKAGPPKKFRFEIAAILDYFSASLLREIDYRGEAQRQIEVAQRLPAHKPIVVARVFPELSSATILTQSFEASSPLARIRDWWPEEARRECARLLLDYFLHAVFVARSVHTDPHPGNLGFRNAAAGSRGNYELVLYDFGSTMSFEEQQVAILWKLIHAYQHEHDVVPFDYLVALGFDAQKLLPLSQRLPCLMERLLEPFCQERAFDFRQWDLKNHFEQVLGEDRWWFRSAGPPWFLMLMRAMQGLVHALTELGVPVSVKAALRELHLPLPTVEVPPVLTGLQSDHKANTGAMARSLKVSVRDHQQGELVRLELPSRAVDELEELIPEETLARMKDQSLDLSLIKRRIQQSGYAPQILFEAETAERRYRVWLQ
jgi:predicted unusual protein kinase regulating ubiquinone biosynthesis (AarF/ABC1/UbiB family)